MERRRPEGASKAQGEGISAVGMPSDCRRIAVDLAKVVANRLPLQAVSVLEPTVGAGQAQIRGGGLSQFCFPRFVIWNRLSARVRDSG